MFHAQQHIILERKLLKIQILHGCKSISFIYVTFNVFRFAEDGKKPKPEPVRNAWPGPSDTKVPI